MLLNPHKKYVTTAFSNSPIFMLQTIKKSTDATIKLLFRAFNAWAVVSTYIRTYTHSDRLFPQSTTAGQVGT